MNKEFLAYEESLALKELGYDIPSLRFYTKKNLCLGLSPDGDTNSKLDSYGMDYVSAPLFQQVFQWFRKEHNMFGVVLTDQTSYPKFAFEISIYQENFNWAKEILSEYLYRSYEEAELACIQKLISHVKK